MSKSILTHANHVDIIAELRSNNEAEHAVCVRLAARFGVGKARIYEIRHGIHMPPCCVVGGAVKSVKKAAAPTSELPIVGFRMWNYSANAEGKPRLTSYNTHFGEWRPGEKYAATCGNGNSHAVPSQKECCGVHAYKAKSAADILARSSDGILGAVIMYGTVRENTHGYRAQFARPVAFTVVPAMQFFTVKERDVEAHRVELRTKRTEKLAKEYGVPIVPYEHIELYVSEFGRLLPIGR